MPIAGNLIVFKDYVCASEEKITNVWKEQRPNEGIPFETDKTLNVKIKGIYWDTNSINSMIVLRPE